ncbi:MAG: cob(I)yrinic acid a,c-diamide adenosyltransferase [Deltaproteobacteria bacterium]|nr:cob(I)yrinic acid a,c-diamide adenosyltransferase [Deltaproteobacteria bacterium]
MSVKSLVHIYTGDGKGKTTAAIGLAARAAGWGKRVLFVQFFKEDSAPSGELDFLRKAGIELIRSNCRHPIFTKARTGEAALGRAIAGTYDAAKKKALDGEIDLLVLDEIMSAINGGWISADNLLAFLSQRPAALEVVLTGRDAPVALVEAADYVTEMLKIKHPFDAGTGARPGVEY